MTGFSAARTMSHPEVAVRAIRRRWRGHRAARPSRCPPSATRPVGPCAPSRAASRRRQRPAVRHHLHRSVGARRATSAELAGRPEVHMLVRERHQLRRWVAAMTTRRSAISPISSSIRSVPSGSRCAIGSSSSSSVSVESQARASATRCRCPADRPNPSSPIVVDARRQAATTSSRATARRAGHSSGSEAGCPRVRASLMRARGEEGPLRHVVRGGRGHRARGRQPWRPAMRSSRVDLPAPDGPVTTVRPDPATRPRSRMHGSRPSGIREVHAFQVHLAHPARRCRDLGALGTGGARGAVTRPSWPRTSSSAVAPSAAAWYS